jgi:hypothetical protein
VPEHSERVQQHGLHVRTVLAVFGALALIVLFIAVAVHAFAKWRDTPLAGPNSPMNADIAGPQLESAPQYDRAQFFAEKQRLLDSYGWIDRQKGVARIPIDVAIEMIAAREKRTTPVPTIRLKAKESSGLDREPRGVER